MGGCKGEGGGGAKPMIDAFCVLDLVYTQECCTKEGCCEDFFFLSVAKIVHQINYSLANDAKKQGNLAFLSF